jgi:hypothetical protein
MLGSGSTASFFGKPLGIKKGVIFNNPVTAFGKVKSRRKTNRAASRREFTPFSFRGSFRERISVPPGFEPMARAKDARQESKAARFTYLDGVRGKRRLDRIHAFNRLETRRSQKREVARRRS